ncbi:MAG: CoA pyrophosphatase [Candidatus Aminicenantes bacterium]|nr:CoA pyrophosphatase [Candidatus Aminicenantes bacterium]
MKTLGKNLKKGNPGLKAQLKMAPRPRPGHRAYEEISGDCTKAGVLVLLYPREEKLHLILTKRTARLSRHQAQISFPGGRQDPRESLPQTALREAREELDIPPDSVCVMGELTPLYIPPSNFCIFPIVATTPRRPDFSPSPKEVSEMIEVPLAHLLDPRNRREEDWIIRGVRVAVPFYEFEGHKVWGATAMVLAELLDMVRQTD